MVRIYSKSIIPHHELAKEVDSPIPFRKKNLIPLQSSFTAIPSIKNDSSLTSFISDYHQYFNQKTGLQSMQHFTDVGASNSAHSYVEDSLFSGSSHVDLTIAAKHVTFRKMVLAKLSKSSQ